MRAKLFISFFVLLFLASLTGCKEGIYNVGGSEIEIKMPTVSISTKYVADKTICSVFVGVEKTEGVIANAPKVQTDNPFFNIVLAQDQTTKPTVEKWFVYTVKVEDELLKPEPFYRTFLSVVIPSEARLLKVRRGPDLDEIFSLKRGVNTLSVKARDGVTLPTPVKDSPEFESSKRIRGKIATVVTENPLISPKDSPYTFEQKNIMIWKFPFRIMIEEGNVFQANFVKLGVRTESELYWLGPGNLFPNPVIEQDFQQVTPNQWFFVDYQNVVYNYETEVLASAKSGEMPGIDLFLTSQARKEADFVINGTEFTIPWGRENPKPESPRQTTTWGFLKHQ